VTRLIPLLHSQIAPSMKNDLWSDFCGQRMWRLVEFTEE